MIVVTTTSLTTSTTTTSSTTTSSTSSSTSTSTTTPVVLLVSSQLDTTSGSPCTNFMSAAFNFYNVALAYIQSDTSHGEVFNSERNTPKGSFPNRMSRYEQSMKSWGRRFDKRNCVCDQSKTHRVQQIANELNDPNFENTRKRMYERRIH